MSEIKEATLTKTKVETKADEKGYVYVHLNFHAGPHGEGIRIWHSTFLIDHHSAHESKLVHAWNIAFAPQWTLLEPNQLFQFLLVFEALPKSCKVFDLFERIPEDGGFEIKSIGRNKSDVYRLKLV